MFVTIFFFYNILTPFIGNSIMKLELKVACGPDLQNYVTLDYFDLRQCSYFRYMKFLIFLRHVSHMGFDLLVPIGNQHCFALFLSEDK